MSLDPFNLFIDQPVLTRLGLVRLKAKGFSLVELMIILAVSAILVSIAIPSFQSTLARARVSGAVNLVEASLDTMRNEAVGKNRITSICRSADPFAAIPACSDSATSKFASDDWGVGWIIYTKPLGFDTLTDSALAFDNATDQIVQRVVPADASSEGPRTTIRWNPAISRLSMSAQGTRINSAANATMLTVDYRIPSEPVKIANAKCIAINLMVRPTVSSPMVTGC